MTLSSSLFNSCWYKLKHLQKPVSSDSYSLATHGVRNHLHLFILNLLVVSSLIQWSFFLVRKERTIIPCSLSLTYIFINVPAAWKQNTDFLLKNNSWNQIFFTLDDQMKQQEVACLYTACPAVLQFPDKTVDLGTSCCPCFLNLSVQVIRLLHTVWLAFQGYLKKKGFPQSALTQACKKQVCRGRRWSFSYKMFSHFNHTVTDHNENSKNFSQPLALCKPTGDICVCLMGRKPFRGWEFIPCGHWTYKKIWTKCVFQNDLGFKHAVSNIFFYQMAVESRAVKGQPMWRSLRNTKQFLHNTAHQMQVQATQDIYAAAQGSGMVYLG